MSTRKKPDFSTGGGGIVDPEFLPADVRREALLHLEKSPLTDEQKSALINFASKYGQIVMGRALHPAAQQHEQIERVASESRRLLASLHALSAGALEALHTHTDELAYLSQPPVDLDDGIKAAMQQPGGALVSNVWDWVEALQKTADYTAQQLVVDKRPTAQMRDRGYISLLAEQVRRMTGGTPPKDSASWFAGFAGCFGEHLGMASGPRIVASAIEAIR